LLEEAGLIAEKNRYDREAEKAGRQTPWPTCELPKRKQSNPPLSLK